MNQETAFSILKSGRNVFLTGSAGAGKTYVLNRYIRYLKERKMHVAVTASTGIAATHMNGMTIHSWSGMGVKDTITERDLKNMQSKKYLANHLADVHVLIVDEISMLHRNQLDMVNRILQFFKQTDQAFGGIQIVFSGDFFQLPPIGRGGETNRQKFAFMSPSWVQANLAICYITEQHRQKDNDLNIILNEIRNNQPSANAIKLLEKSKHNKLGGKFFTKLYTHNVDVDRINMEELKKLPEKPETYTAKTKGNEKLLMTLKKSVLTEEFLNLKHGARVMFVKNNYDKGYMNGTLGEITGFNDEGIPEVLTTSGKHIEAEPEVWSIDDDKGKTLASFTQVPLRLAWAITVHKSQGMTLENAEIDLGKTFEKGQGYVALSRLKDLSGLQLFDFNEIALEVDALVLRADLRFRELSEELANDINVETLEKAATEFIEKCGGLTNPEEIEKNRKKQKEKKGPKRPTFDITKEYLELKLSIDEIANERGLTIGTIIGHMVKLSELHPDFDMSYYKPDEAIIKQVQSVSKPKSKEVSLYQETSRIKKELTTLSYEEIKLALLFV